MHTVVWQLIPHVKQDVALTGPNRTGPLCSVGRATAHSPGPAADDRPPAALQTTSDKTTDTSEQNNNDPLGGPVIMCNELSQNPRLHRTRNAITFEHDMLSHYQNIQCHCQAVLLEKVTPRILIVRTFSSGISSGTGYFVFRLWCIPKCEVSHKQFSLMRFLPEISLTAVNSLTFPGCQI